jgi:hypothetical protein
MMIPLMISLCAIAALLYPKVAGLLMSHNPKIAFNNPDQFIKTFFISSKNNNQIFNL